MPKISSIESMRFNWPDDPLGGWIEVNHLTGPIVQAIVVSNTETVTTLDSDNKTIALAERRDAEGIRDKIAIKAIKAWGNFYDAGDEEIPCTPANICRFTVEEGFVAALNKFRKELREHLQAKQEAAEKN